MPTYEYRCSSCSHQFERFQRMTDDPVRECELCGCEVQRILFPVAVHFKGSGFYTTDYGKKNTLKAGSSSSSSCEGEPSAKCDSCEKAPAKTASATD